MLLLTSTTMPHDGVSHSILMDDSETFCFDPIMEGVRIGAIGACGASVDRRKAWQP
jgi:hypothetical protein